MLPGMAISAANASCPEDAGEGMRAAEVGSARALDDGGEVAAAGNSFGAGTSGTSTVGAGGVGTGSAITGEGGGVSAARGGGVVPGAGLGGGGSGTIRGGGCCTWTGGSVRCCTDFGVVGGGSMCTVSACDSGPGMAVPGGAQQQEKCQDMSQCHGQHACVGKGLACSGDEACGL